MNNLLKQLAKEAGFSVPTVGMTSEDFGIKLGEKNVDKELKVFAELIIRECIRVDIINLDTSPGDAIREHFNIDG